MLSLLVGMMAGFGVSAAEEPTVEIVSKNVYYADTLRLMYAVKATEGYDVAVKIYNAEDELVGNGIAGDGEKVPKTVDIDGVSCLVFVSDFGVPAQDIDTELFAVAELSNGTKSKVERYSVLEYLYERLLVSKNVSSVQKTMYKNLISYADSLGVLLNSELKEGEAPIDVVSDYSYVRVENGTVDGYSAGMYKVGTKLSELNLGTDYVVQESGNVLSWEVKAVNESGTQQGVVTTVYDSEKDTYALTNYSTIIKATESVANAKTYTATLLKDVSGLTDGAKIIIVAKDSDVALSTEQKTSNRASVAITKDGDMVAFDENVAVQVVTLEKVGDNYYLMVGDGECLYTSGGNENNTLKTTTKDENKCQWSITIDANGVAVIKNVSNSVDGARNQLRYYETKSSSLFNCYASGQKDIAIYIINE